MRIQKIVLTNIRSFVGTHTVEPSPGINLFVGHNNSGKSTILHSALHFQMPSYIANDAHVGGGHASFLVEFEKSIETEVAPLLGTCTVKFPNLTQASVLDNGHVVGRQIQSLIPVSEPDNYFYPFLSSRKVSTFQETVNAQYANALTGNFTSLFSKVDRIVAPHRLPQYSDYVEACNDIIGFPVSSTPSPAGKHALYFTEHGGEIPISRMGEGVANMLSLIIDLCEAKNKIFLIEEPENDLHPKALKALLKLIAKSSATNQFLISTHSNIAVRHLGALTETKVFQVTSDFEKNANQQNIFASKVEEVSDSPEDRMQLLADMGYEFADFDLWSSWLILEESSAERIIRDLLIPWFADKLRGRLRTFSSSGTSKVSKRFEDLNSLFVFLHLSEAYKNKAWVIIDAGDAEEKITANLRTKYATSGWNAAQFQNWSMHDFEQYYPEIFEVDVQAILVCENRQEKRQLKKELLTKVLDWAEESPTDAKSAFQVSALEVIDFLKDIESQH